MRDSERRDSSSLGSMGRGLVIRLSGALGGGLPVKCLPGKSDHPGVDHQHSHKKLGVVAIPLLGRTRWGSLAR